MNIPRSLYLLNLLTFFFVFTADAQSVRERTSFNENWRFQKGDPVGTEGQLSYPNIKDWVRSTGNEFVLTSSAVKSQRPSENLGENVSHTRADFNDSAWRRLDLPHDWAIEGDFVQALRAGTGKRPFEGVGWYRKTFSIPQQDKGKQIYIDFDGAMAYSSVWLNGQFVGGWPYGYTSFRLDLTPSIKYGRENVIAVRLENLPESSRWYPGAGIYRNVWLVKTAPVHIGQWGTYVTTPEVSRDRATVAVRTTVQNDSGAKTNVQVRTSIFEHGRKGSKPIAVTKQSAIDIGVDAPANHDATVQIDRPKLWSPSSPSLYVAVTEIEVSGKIVDRYETVFGIRSIKFDAEKGFLLNGERLYMKGVCQHHDLGALGAAVNYRALERQLEILKEMGVNAIRTSHNPPTPELLDLTDRMGFVVIDEGFDAWVRGKMKNDFHLIFPDWHEKDWRSQIRRDRNHPSVVLWSIGNEIWEQGTPEGHKVASELTAIAHEEDPTRPTTAGANDVRSGYNGFQKTVDVFGYNYKPHEYVKFHEANPAIPFVASETASTVSTRGEYFFPVVEDKLKGRFNFQVSSYDLYAPPWATPPDTEFEGQDRATFSGGEFVWTGFDYLGEPTPYDDGDTTKLLNFTDAAAQARAAEELKATGKITTPSRSSYFGIVDLAGFKKDRFYIYQARWRPELPMAHILPHWNWPERIGQVTPVHVYTSGDEAELFLNGKSLGRKKRGAMQYRFRWDDVVYQPGELKVFTYKNGKPWAEDVVKTTGAASAIQMTADRNVIAADGRDLAFITIKIGDKNGLNVPRSKNLVEFQISGPGEIVATDNGDPTDLSSFQSTTRKAFNGMALVIVRSVKGKPGRIVIKASSAGLKGAEIVITGKR